MNKYSPEVRELAVRLVQNRRGEYPLLKAAVESIAPKMTVYPRPCLIGSSATKSMAVSVTA